MRPNHFTRADTVYSGLPQPGKPPSIDFSTQRAQFDALNAHGRERLMASDLVATKCRALLLETIRQSSVPHEKLRVPSVSFIARFLGVWKDAAREEWAALELSAFDIARAISAKAVSSVKFLLRWMALGPVRDKSGNVVGMGVGLIASERRGGVLPDGRCAVAAAKGGTRRLRAILRSSLRFLTPAGCILLGCRGKFGGEVLARAPMKLAEWFRGVKRRLEHRQDPLDVWRQAHEEELLSRATAGVPPPEGSLADFWRALSDVRTAIARKVMAGEDADLERGLARRLEVQLGALAGGAPGAAGRRAPPSRPPDPDIPF